jgi:hypothetical protein
MWCIARVDAPTIEEMHTSTWAGTFLVEPGLFGLVWAPRMRDLPDFNEVRTDSGFCRPQDDLVMLRPDGTVKTVDVGGAR